jgi:hypothetical protein
MQKCSPYWRRDESQEFKFFYSFLDRSQPWYNIVSPTLLQVFEGHYGLIKLTVCKNKKDDIKRSKACATPSMIITKGIPLASWQIIGLAHAFGQLCKCQLLVQ